MEASFLGDPDAEFHPERPTLGPYLPTYVYRTLPRCGSFPLLETSKLLTRWRIFKSLPLVWQLRGESLMPSFDNFADLRLGGSHKVPVHTLGFVGKVAFFTWNGHYSPLHWP